MFDTRRWVGTTTIFGVSSTLVAGLIVSIGVIWGAPGDSTRAALPAAALQASAPVATSAESQSAPVVEVAPRPETSTAPAASGNSTPAIGNPTEPAGALSEEPSVVFDRLVLVGDSLAEATEPVIRYATPEKEFVRKFFGGTAPCDWLDDDLEATATTVVVITFTGNSLTPCMTDGAGSQLRDAPLIEKYRADVGVLIDRATAAGAWVVLIGQPLRHPVFEADLEVEGINAAYQQYASTRSHVSYVDAGRFVETADGRYTDRLPCLDLDPDCAPDGTTVVRGDGVHFCPVVNVNPCPVWSSGAVRFGLGIASAANDPVSFE